RVFTYYKVTLAPETQALVTNMGLQFVCGTLAAFIIFTTIFIRIYKIYLQIDSGKKTVVTPWVMYHFITRKT
ncbi:MAG TPA: hypothetical protein PK024_05005, partial [Methanospirillum sp.]|uniref:hypothetical protein n=1 Tax=Methanospirillum sp. TaxID=45200 RepID=UPI002CE01677